MNHVKLFDTMARIFCSLYILTPFSPLPKTPCRVSSRTSYSECPIWEILSQMRHPSQDNQDRTWCPIWDFCCNIIIYSAQCVCVCVCLFVCPHGLPQLNRLAYLLGFCLGQSQSFKVKRSRGRYQGKNDLWCDTVCMISFVCKRGHFWLCFATVHLVWLCYINLVTQTQPNPGS